MPKKIDPNILANLSLETERRPDQSKISNVLGVDYGEKFSGLAWVQEGVVFPLVVVPTLELLGEIKQTVAKKSIQQIVLGLPIGGQGEENHVCEQIRAFGTSLTGQGLSVEYINERFSTQNTISSDDERRDDLAAAQILEFWLAQK